MLIVFFKNNSNYKNNDLNISQSFYLKNTFCIKKGDLKFLFLAFRRFKNDF